MFLSLRYWNIVSYFLSTTFSVTKILPRRDSANCKLLHLYFHQNTKSTTVLCIYNIFKERHKAFLNIFLIDVALMYQKEVKTPKFINFLKIAKRRLKDVLKWHLESDIFGKFSGRLFWTFNFISINVVLFSSNVLCEKLIS